MNGAPPVPVGPHKKVGPLDKSWQKARRAEFPAAIGPPPRQLANRDFCRTGIVRRDSAHQPACRAAAGTRVRCGANEKSLLADGTSFASLRVAPQRPRWLH